MTSHQILVFGITPKVQVGRFVKLLNIFTRDYFGDGSWVDFHYARGEHGGFF